MPIPCIGPMFFWKWDQRIGTNIGPMKKLCIGPMYSIQSRSDAFMEMHGTSALSMHNFQNYGCAYSSITELKGRSHSYNIDDSRPQLMTIHGHPANCEILSAR